MEPDYVKIKDIKPALTGYLNEAYGLMSPAEGPDEKAVHDVRVLMKKSRASIKLLKSQIFEGVYQKEYSVFREAGRILRTWRETSVHRKTLKSLKKKYPELFISIQKNEKLAELLQKYESGPDPRNDQDIEAVKEMLRKSVYRIRFHSLSELDPHLLLKDLEASYIIVKELFIKALNTKKPSTVHEFRKKAKDFLYQLFFFRALHPRVIRSLERRLDSMTQNLGKYNDLSVLKDVVDYTPGSNGNDELKDELLVIIRLEQEKFLSKVWPEAYQIFCPGKVLVNLLGFKLLVI